MCIRDRVTVFTKRSVIGGGRWPGVWYKHIWALLCRKQATKFLDPSLMATDRPFSGLGEELWMPRATSRPLDHRSTWYLRGSHLHPPALPCTNRVGRGLNLCRDRKPIVAWAVVDQRVDSCQCKSASSAAYSTREQILIKQHTYSRFPHSGGTRVSSADFFFVKFGNKTWQHRVYIVIGLRTDHSAVVKYESSKPLLNDRKTISMKISSTIAKHH